MIFTYDWRGHVGVRRRHRSFSRNDHAGLIPVRQILAVLAATVGDRRHIGIVVTKTEDAPHLLRIDAAMDAMELLRLICWRIVFTHECPEVTT